jgi:hypothetical protein
VTTTCLDCGRHSQHSRCPLCQNRRDRLAYGGSWRAFSQGQRQAEPWCHTEPHCPYPDAGSRANPLTTDHVDLGLVICARCNASKQHVDRRLGRVAGATP